VLKENEDDERARELLEEVTSQLQEQRELQARVERLVQESSTLATGGEHHEAMRRVQEALDLDPTNEMALELRARIDERVAAAEEAARRAAEEEARQAAEQEARRAAEQEARRAAEQQARKAAEQEARKAAEPEARRTAKGEATEEEVRLDAAITEETITMKGRRSSRPSPTVVESHDTVAAEEESSPGVLETVFDPPPGLAAHRWLVDWALNTTPGRVSLGVAALLVVLLGFGLSGGGEAPGAGAADAGRLAVDAIPWARVTAIVDADGRQVEVGDDPVTPVSFDLAPGSYTVTLQGPDGEETRSLEASIEASAERSLLAEFQRIDVDAYFEEAGWQSGR